MVQFPHSSSVQSKMLHQVCYEHLEHLYLKDAKQQSWVESAGSSSFQLQLPRFTFRRWSKAQFESSKSTCKCMCTPSRKPSRDVLTLPTVEKEQSLCPALRSQKTSSCLNSKFRCWNSSGPFWKSKNSNAWHVHQMWIKCYMMFHCFMLLFKTALLGGNWVDTQPVASLAKPKAGSAGHCSAFGAWKHV